MALSYKARRRWALFILLIGLPIYIVLAVNIATFVDLTVTWWWLEFVIYVALGVIWIVPFNFIFKGIGQADPDADPYEDR